MIPGAVDFDPGFAEYAMGESGIDEDDVIAVEFSSDACLCG